MSSPLASEASPPRRPRKWPPARAYGFGWGFLGLLLLQEAVTEVRRWRVGHRREPLLYLLFVVVAFLYVIPRL